MNVKHCEKGTGIAIGPLSVNPFNYDFMEIEATINPAVDAKQVNVFWHNDYLNPEQNKNVATALPFDSTNEQGSEYKTYRVPLSRYWRWFTNAQAQGLWLEFRPCQSITIKSICLLSDCTLVPKLEIDDLQSDNTGVYQLDRQDLNLQVDASQVGNCNGAKLEISKANYFFDNFDSYNTEQAVMSNIVIDQAAKKFSISNKTFPAPGYYQLRIIGLNQDGKPTGEWSDPLTIKI